MGMTMFSCVCWIALKNIVIISVHGLGMSVLTFDSDWAMIAICGNLRVTPVDLSFALLVVHTQ